MSSNTKMKFGKIKTPVTLIFSVAVLGGMFALLRFGAHPVAAAGQEPVSQPSAGMRLEKLEQSQADADAKSLGCVSCHTTTDSATMHLTGTVRLGCIDCHTGDATVSAPPNSKAGAEPYDQAKRQAHPRAKFSEDERSSANPVRSYTRWLQEDLQYIQFVNPGD